MSRLKREDRNPLRLLRIHQNRPRREKSVGEGADSDYEKRRGEENGKDKFGRTS